MGAPAGSAGLTNRSRFRLHIISLQSSFSSRSGIAFNPLAGISDHPKLWTTRKLLRQGIPGVHQLPEQPDILALLSQRCPVPG